MIAAKFQAVISGHTHKWRVDKPTANAPITQIVGGGPKTPQATFTVVEATQNTLAIRIESANGDTLTQETWPT